MSPSRWTTCVITSYSIHYTKLYELLLIGWAVLLYGLFALLWFTLSDRILSQLVGSLTHINQPSQLIDLVSWISLLSFSGVLVITMLLLLLMRQHWGSLLPVGQSSPSMDDLPLRHFYEQSFIAMAISSPDSRRWLQFNNQLCKLLGYSRDELLRISWDELTHPEDRAENLALFEQVIGGQSEVV